MVHVRSQYLIMNYRLGKVDVYKNRIGLTTSPMAGLFCSASLIFFPLILGLTIPSSNPLTAIGIHCATQMRAFLTIKFKVDFKIIMHLIEIIVSFEASGNMKMPK